MCLVVPLAGRVGAVDVGAAAGMAPGAGQRGQAHDVAHRHAASGVALQPVVEPDRRGRQKIAGAFAPALTVSQGCRLNNGPWVSGKFDVFST